MSFYIGIKKCQKKKRKFLEHADLLMIGRKLRMKEIKFRVWDKERKKICAVHNLAFHDEIYGYKVITIEEATRGGDFHATFTTIEKFELMQYTGLKDKNGVEIYEGDIGYDPHDDTYGVVKFEEGKFIYEWENVSDDLIECVESLEISGNIYKNLELLEDGK